MFSSRSNKHGGDSFSKSRVGKSFSSKSKRSFRDYNTSIRRPPDLDISSAKQRPPPRSGPPPESLTSAIITLAIGPPASARLFAAHENVLTTSPFFKDALRSVFYAQPDSSPHASPTSASQKQLSLPDEIAEVFSSVLEYLYKGDYFPKLEYDKRRNTWQLENAAASPGNSDSTVWVSNMGHKGYGGAYGGSAADEALPILKDTVIYCAAEKYGLPDLKRLALRKQGLQSGIPVGTILASARYAYAHTPESDSKLRGHYLQLIIRSRSTFKRSGTMQVQMGSPRADSAGGIEHSPGPQGTGLWFDLFVAMCNHLDDMEKIVKSPR